MTDHLTADLPAGVRVGALPRGVRIGLPSVDRSRWLAGAAVAFIGVCFLAFAVFWAAVALSMAGVGQPGGPGPLPAPLAYAIAGVGLVPAIIGLGFLGLTLVFLFGRRTVELRGHKVGGGARLGPVGLIARRPLDALDAIAVDEYQRLARRAGDPDATDAPGQSGRFAVALLFRDRRPITIADTDGRAHASALARAVADQLEHHGPPGSEIRVDDRLAADPHAHEPAELPDPADLAQRIVSIPDPPADAPWDVTRLDDGLSVHAPKTGFRSPNASVTLTIGVIFAGVSPFVAAMFATGLRSPGGGWQLAAAAPVLIGLVGTIVGLALILASVGIATREVYLDAVGGGLIVTESGRLFRDRCVSLAPGEVERITVEKSDTSVNNVRLRELVIRPRDGAELRLLKGADRKHLGWLARALSAAAGV